MKSLLEDTTEHYVLFIDFRSAYNTIIRNKIYKILVEKNTLNRDEVQFMKNMHNKVHFKDEKNLKSISKMEFIKVHPSAQHYSTSTSKNSFKN